MVEGSEEKTPIGIETSDPSSATFTLHNEDHTIGNTLRYVLNRSPEVSFVGYSVPHPSEPIMNIRLQTLGSPATKVLHGALGTVYDMSKHILSTFESSVETFRQRQEGEDKMES